MSLEDRNGFKGDYAAMETARAVNPYPQGTSEFDTQVAHQFYGGQY